MILDWLNPLMSEAIARWILFVIGFVTLMVKVIVLMWLFVQVRFTVPRFRYDQLMKLGWVYLLPIALVNLVVVAVISALVKF